LDDFCKKFHGGENTGPNVVPYSFDDVVAGMNEVYAYDWRRFFMERLASHGPGAPLGGLENSGWKLVYNETPNEHQKAEELVEQTAGLEYSLGFEVHLPAGEESDRILDVIPGSPAAKAGMSAGMRLVAVNGRKWTPEFLRAAIQSAKSNQDPIELLAQNGDYFQTYHVDYHGGERYPHLETIRGKPDVLAEIARMKAPAVALPTSY
jgi:predicted metalloprotease with PDZ domain